jgi:hypothetical protein
VLEQTLIDGQQFGASGERMARDEPIERVSGETEVERAFARFSKERVDQIDAVVVGEVLGNPPPGLPDSSDLKERLQLEHNEWRHGQVGDIERPPYRFESPTISRPEPQGDVCVDVNHSVGFQTPDQSK